MIIQSLCRHYDILEGDENVNIPKLGYSSANVSFALVISSDGVLSHIIDLRSDDKKPKPRNMDVPIQKSRAVEYSRILSAIMQNMFLVLKN